MKKIIIISLFVLLMFFLYSCNDCEIEDEERLIKTKRCVQFYTSYTYVGKMILPTTYCVKFETVGTEQQICKLGKWTPVDK